MNDYRGRHQPDPDGVPMHRAGDAFPGIYERPELYRHGDEHYDECLAVILAGRDKPDALVSVYRAVPPGVELVINPGDWVTPAKSYAELHGMHATDPAKDWPVVHKVVRACELLTEGNDVTEWGYFPPIKGD